MEPKDHSATRRQDQGDLTQLLQAWSAGDERALDELIPLVYGDLRKIAARELATASAPTLQPTALVHELYLRLAKDEQTAWQNRAHFFAVACTAMRRILVDQARRRAAAKRGGGKIKLSFDEQIGAGQSSETVDVLAINDALQRLTRDHPMQGRIVEMRFFGGLSHEEIAGVMGVSVPTVKRKWRVARAWLFRDLDTQPPATHPA